MFSLLLPVVLLSTTPRGKEIVLKGRFVAQAQNNLEDVGSFIGYSQLYVFQIENLYGHPELVKVSYTFRTIKDQLSSEYLDYSVVHSFTVTRNTLCDDSLEHMAYTQGFDDKGRPVEHQFTLKLAKGAPKLEITKEKLPCYALTPKGLNSDAQQK